MDTRLQLNGKVAIITGSSTGLGAGIAVLFAKLGARVCLTGRREGKLQDVAAQCEEASPEKLKPAILVGDITEQVIRKKLIEVAVDTFGKLDILVNNAGVAAFGNIEQTSLEKLDFVLDVNFRAPYDLTKMAIPHIIATKGCIVNISSSASRVANYDSLLYNISKAALDHFTKCLSVGLLAKGVRVNSVNPGFVPTEILVTAGLPDKLLHHHIDNLNSRGIKIGTVDDVAQMVAFVASDAAAFMTGAINMLDGGAINLCSK